MVSGTRPGCRHLPVTDHEPHRHLLGVRQRGAASDFLTPALVCAAGTRPVELERRPQQTQTHRS